MDNSVRNSQQLLLFLFMGVSSVSEVIVYFI